MPSALEANVLGQDHNKVRDADELDLTSLIKEPDGNYYLWDKNTPDRTIIDMNSYRNLLGNLFKVSLKTMNGNQAKYTYIK